MELSDVRRGSTQRKILQEILHADSPLGVDYLSRSLAISRNATYQHLMALERDGLIEKAELSQTRGRPGQTYRLTEAGQNTFPKNYSLIASLLISLMKSRFGPDELKACLAELGISLAQNFEARVTGLSAEARMQAVTEIMRELGYEAEFVSSQSGGASQICAHNCVFHHLAKRHEEVCSLDLALLEKLLDGPVEHSECVVRGDSCCRFKMVTKD